MVVKLLLTLMMLTSFESLATEESESVNHDQTTECTAEAEPKDDIFNDGFEDDFGSEFDEGLKMAEDLKITVEIPKPLSSWEVLMRRIGTPLVVYYISLRVWLSDQSNNLYSWYLTQTTSCPFGFGKKE